MSVGRRELLKLCADSKAVVSSLPTSARPWGRYDDRPNDIDNLRTAQRWVNRYRQFGRAGLVRSGRSDHGKRRRITISRPTVVARLRTPRSTDAGDAAADRSPRCSPGQPYCRRRSFPLVCARGVSSSCVQPIAASIGTFAMWIPCGINSLAMLCAESRLRMACHRKGTARRKPFERRARVREDGRPLRAVGIRSVFAHAASCLLTYQKRAERRVSNCLEHHAWLGFGNTLAKNAGNPAVDVVHDKRRSPKVSNDILKQQLHGRWLAHRTRIDTRHVSSPAPAGPACPIPGRDADPHTAFREQPRATRADPGSTSNDECNILYGRLRARFVGFGHVSCSQCRSGTERGRR